jgi:hypothetical protein
MGWFRLLSRGGHLQRVAYADELGSDGVSLMEATVGHDEDDVVDLRLSTVTLMRATPRPAR